MYDVAIIGAGASGITTAIYCSRAGLKVALIERGLYGGQLNNTEDIENYSGFSYVKGAELAGYMEEQAKALSNVDHIYGDVKSLDKEEDIFKIGLRKKAIHSKTVVIATGVTHKKLSVIGEDDYEGKGVSYCSVCDGAFFKGKNVAVIGGGDSAVESALYLSNIANKVTLMHRGHKLRAEQINQDKLFSKSNVEFVWNANTVEIHGNETEGVKSLTYHPVMPNGEAKSIDVDGVFVNIGVVPNTDFITFGAGSFIQTDSIMQTGAKGIYAVGDVREDSIRQVVSATGDGAMASSSIIEYLRNT